MSTSSDSMELVPENDSSALRMIQHFPREIRDCISKSVVHQQNASFDSHGNPSNLPQQDASFDSPGNPSIPPRDGLSPFLDLPLEIRRQIFKEFLPAKGRVVVPSTLVKEQSRIRHLLVLNKQICAELSEILYEERNFVVTVHEGIRSGGIEFLNSGRQRLQWKRTFDHVRFQRFEDDNAFGFHRIKRLSIDIYPSADEKTPHSRHDSIHTHFMVRALIKLLKCGGEESVLTYLEINFKGLEWWNQERQAPRQTTIHGVSNIELLLRPFFRLRKVHNMAINFSETFSLDPRIQRLSQDLIGALGRGTALSTMEDSLEEKIGVAREALDLWLEGTRSKKHHDLPDKDIWFTTDDLRFEGEGEDDEHVHSTSRKRTRTDAAFSDDDTVTIDATTTKFQRLSLDRPQPHSSTAAILPSSSTSTVPPPTPRTLHQRLAAHRQRLLEVNAARSLTQHQASSITQASASLRHSPLYTATLLEPNTPPQLHAQNAWPSQPEAQSTHQVSALMVLADAALALAPPPHFVREDSAGLSGFDGAVVDGQAFAGAARQSVEESPEMEWEESGKAPGGA